MFLLPLAELSVPSALSGTVLRDYVRFRVSVVLINPRVVR
jgi:hypothetical protein